MFVKAPEIKYDFETEKELENKLEKVAKKIAEKLELSLDIDQEFKEVNTIKYSDVKYINYTFHKEKFKVKFRVQIPRYSDGMIYIKGVRRYVQKQIRDLLWILPNNRYTKLLLGDAFITLNERGSIEVNRVTTYGVLLYYYFLNEHYGKKLREDRLEPIFKSHEVFSSEYQQYKNSRSSIYKKLISLQAPGKINKVITTLDLLFHVVYEDFVNEYFTDIADMIEKMFYLLPMKYKDEGLDLSVRRIRKEMDIVYDAYVSFMIDKLTDTLFINTRKQQVYDLEPTKHLYDFILMEQFPAPLATVSDRYRATILGLSTGGYGRENVPIKVRNLHDSHMWNLDPAVTPDRDNAGIVLYIAANAKIDKFGRFINLIDKGKEQINSLYEEGRLALLSDEISFETITENQN